MSAVKVIRGTREWAVANIDCCTGCPHDCRYCYARYDQVVKRGVLTDDDWRSCQIRPDDVERTWPKYSGQVMFPTTHDILPENLEACIKVIQGLLDADNQVLIVSKPHVECIDKLCRVFSDRREHILFRFTITARDERLLSFWEPGAPDYEERKASLCLAHREGFVTSVSVEPMLDTADVVMMVQDLLPCVSHSIWLGKMNKIEKRVRIESAEVKQEVERITVGQQDKIIRSIHRSLKDEKKVRWKESIKMVVGLPLAQEAGEDR